MSPHSKGGVMEQKEAVVITAADLRTLGQIMAGAIGLKANEILHKTFGSRLSYTRGEPEHTAFLEGQKSVLQFIDNAVKAAKAESAYEQVLNEDVSGVADDASHGRRRRR